MNKEQALRTIGKLSKASIRSWELSNTRARGSVVKAIDDQMSAAHAILFALGIEATEEEVERALE